MKRGRMKEKRIGNGKPWILWLAKAAAAAVLAVGGAACLPMAAQAAVTTGSFADTDGDGQVLSWSYDDETRTLTISGTGELEDQLHGDVFQNMGIEKIAFADCRVLGSMWKAFGGYYRADGSVDYLGTVKYIELSGLDTGSVTDMGRMFYGCSGLTSLDMSGFDTSSVTDMGRMFERCSGLTSLDMSGFDTSSVTNMRSMFERCSGLTSLDMSEFETGSVTDMGSMFYGCSSLTSMDMSGFETGSVTDMSHMFVGCSSLTSLDMSGFETGSVTDMSHMFYGCSSLTSLDMSGFETGSVTDMEYMFWGCSGLTSLDLSGFETGSVMDMGGMFYGCSGLTSLDLSGFETGSVKNMNSMFRDCSGLTSLDLSGFETGSVKNMNSMFRDCSGLTSLDLSGFETSRVTNMGLMFSGCSGLTSLDLSGFETGSVTDMSGMFFFCSSLTSLDLSGFETGSVTNMAGMFNSCSGLTSLDLSGFETGSVTDMSHMFVDCSSLTSMDLSGFETGSVTDMGGMFLGCSSLTSLDMSGFETGSVTDMEYMFWGCSSLTSLDLSSFETGSVTDMRFMFDGCSSLTSMDLSGFDTSSVTDMGWMFTGCSSLTSLDMSGFETGSVTDMNGMFMGCSSLTSLDLSSFDTGSVTVMGDMFSGCSKLRLIMTPKAMNETAADLPGTFVAASGEQTTVMSNRFAGTRLIRAGDAVLQNAVKYVPYHQRTAEEVKEGCTCVLTEGSLPDGLTLGADGALSGIPKEAGEYSFVIAVRNAADGTDADIISFKLTVLDNTDSNVDPETDEGYEIREPVGDQVAGVEADQTLVSVGAYSEFREVYIDGVRLEPETDYTSEEGSTRITIRSQTFARFNQPGKHTIAVEFRRSDTQEAKYAVQNYEIKSPEEQGPDNDTEEEKTEGDGGGDEDTSNAEGDGGGNEDTPNPGTSNNAGNTGGTNSAAAYPDQEEVSEPIYYTVVRGDTLNRIARKNGTILAQLLAWNPGIKNPNLIFPGQILIVGYTKGTAAVETVPADAVYDTVQKGDSLYRIAQRNRTTLQTVIKLNYELAKQKYIYAGQRVRVR